MREIAVIVLGAWLAIAPSAAVGEAPQRVVSLNLCTDQLLVMLAHPDQILAVSHLARDPALSHVADQASALPVTRPEAEAVIRLDPDLVLAGPHGATRAIAMLAARGVTVLRLPLLEDFDAIAAGTRRVGAALGQTQRAEALVTAMQSRLAAVPRQPPGPQRTALLLQAGGFTAGRGTLLDAVLTAAGLHNAAADLRAAYGFVSVEQVVADPPDILIHDLPDRAAPSLAHRLLSHPALAAVPARRVTLAGGLTACGTPATALAVTQLATAVRDL